MHRYGGPEVLTLEEADTPEPGEGQILVRVEAGIGQLVGHDAPTRRRLPVRFAIAVHPRR